MKKNPRTANVRAGSAAEDIYPAFAYVGCFTNKDGNAHGKGIGVYRIDRLTGAWTLVQVSDELHNPGFLVLDRNQRFLYSAHGSSGEISSYSVERKSGKLQILNRQPTGGHNSRYLTIDPAGRYVILNNGPGVVVYPIKRDGSLAPLSDKIVPPAEPGTFREEEKGPHPHHMVFDPGGRFMVVPDKGLDKIHVYKLDAANAKLVANDPPFAASVYGAGPRHMAFHPAKPFAYVVNEVDSTVAVYHWNSAVGKLMPRQVITTIPVAHAGKNTGAEIAVAPSGKFVYASNRGHDSIAVFAVDEGTGTLSPVCWEASQGRKPRFFTLDAGGRLLYAANQDGNSIVSVRVDDVTGRLTPTGHVIETGSPTCIVFAYH